jgi:hypothetical protein
LPRAFAAAKPLLTRSRISSRSNSAMPAMTVASMRPCGVERSKARPLIAITDTRRASSSSSVCSRSSVLRPQRDSSVTSTTSISRRWARAMTLRRSARSARAPEAVSR